MTTNKIIKRLDIIIFIVFIVFLSNFITLAISVRWLQSDSMKTLTNINNNLEANTKSINTMKCIQKKNRDSLRMFEEAQPIDKPDIYFNKDCKE